MTPETISILEHYFALGASDREACFLANIAPATLYDYQTAHPDFAERKALLKNKVTWRAKQNLVSKIEEGSTEDSKWWLERKARDEFATRSEHINANIDATAKLSDEDKSKILSILNANPQS